MIENKKTAIVGGVVGIIILLTIFCCNGKVEEVPVIEEKIEEVIEEVPVQELSDEEIEKLF